MVYFIPENTVDKNDNFVVQCITERGGTNMTISLRLSDEDTILIKKYAEINRLSVSELIRQSIMEKIYDEYDLELFEKAISEHEKNPVTYSLDDVERELGLK